MKNRVRITLVLMFLILSTSDLVSCTLVSIIGDDMILVGNNEDASPLFPTRAIFRQAEGEYYGYVIFGFSDGWPQGGMNDQGLMFGGVAGYSTDWIHDPQKVDYWDNLSLKIMTECASVHEALTVLKQYNNPDLAYSRMMLADRLGESVIVWYDSTLRITHRTKCCQVLGFGEQRAVKWFQKTGEYDASVVQSIMSDCMQRRRNVITLYSLIYDLRNGKIHVFNVYTGRGVLGARRVQGNLILDLNDELARGNHFYNLPLLVSQLHESAKTDFTTFSPKPYSEKDVSRILGTYACESGIQIEIHKDRDRMLMAHSSLPGRTCLLYQVSDRLFFSRVFNFTVELPADKSRPVKAVKLQWINRWGQIACEQGERIH